MEPLDLFSDLFHYVPPIGALHCVIFCNRGGIVKGVLFFLSPNTKTTYTFEKNLFGQLKKLDHVSYPPKLPQGEMRHIPYGSKTLLSCIPAYFCFQNMGNSGSLIGKSLNDYNASTISIEFCNRRIITDHKSKSHPSSRRRDIRQRFKYHYVEIVCVEIWVNKRIDIDIILSIT